MAYNFDLILNRRLTNSNKWGQFPEDDLPLWVADMDFQTPEPIFNALRSSLVFGVIGYGLLPNTLQEAWLDCNEPILDGRIQGSPYEFF